MTYPDPVDLIFLAVILLAYSLPFATMLGVSELQKRKWRASQKARLAELTKRG